MEPLSPEQYAHHSNVAALNSPNEAYNAAHFDMRVAQGKMNVALMQNLPHEQVQELAKEYVAACYKYQKLRWGAVKVKINIAALLR